jgi:hypothetical protein
VLVTLAMLAMLLLMVLLMVMRMVPRTHSLTFAPFAPRSYSGMLWRADVFIGELVALLKARGMYDNTLILYSSDNGGVESGNNYPLRGR